MNAADTAAIQQVGVAVLRKRFFLYRQRSPRTGYIQGRFPASSFWYAQFTTFCSPFQAKSVIFKTSRTSFAPPRLRVRFFRELTHPGSPNRFSSFSSRPPSEDRRKRLFDDILFCVFFVPWVKTHG